MTAVLFEAGLRLAAADRGAVVPRLAGSAVASITNPIAVRAWLGDGQTHVVVATGPDQPVTQASGAQIGPVLDSLGVQISGERGWTLVSDELVETLQALRVWAVAEADGVWSDVAAHLAWWDDRADFPGGWAVVDLVEASRRQWVTGLAPAADRLSATWHTWLGVDEGIAGCLTWLDRLTSSGPAPKLIEAIGGEDARSFASARKEHKDQRTWRPGDNISESALKLRARNDAADLLAGAALQDGLGRESAVHTGEVVSGQITAVPGKAAVYDLTCDQMDARLRVGNQITGWTGEPGDSIDLTFTGEVTSTTVAADQLVLRLRVGRIGQPCNGDRVTIHPSAPVPALQHRMRKNVRGLYRARSWLTRGQTPVPARREVPLDVMIAGAESE